MEYKAPVIKTCFECLRPLLIYDIAAILVAKGQGLMEVKIPSHSDDVIANQKDIFIYLSRIHLFLHQRSL